MKNVMITGAAGFIGSNYVRYALETHRDWNVTVFDKFTYAGNLDNLKDVAEAFRDRYTLVRGDIADRESVFDTVKTGKFDLIVNFAADSHVDRSLTEPGSFIMTDVYGTYILLEAAKEFKTERFHQISTDEVYGDIEGNDRSDENANLRPSSPYSASKTGGDVMVLAYARSFGIPVTITRGTNNIGPYQYPEKVVPLWVTNAIDDLPLPLYGDGKQMRDYQYVLDHCEGIDVVIEKGALGEVYNIGSGVETRNIDLAHSILDMLGKPYSLLQQVTDRAGHDKRYAIDNSKARAIGWTPRHSFAQAIEKTVRWYVENEWWWRKIKNGEFKEYYKAQYEGREVNAR
jgi:dTDP-glucose 4,6-dehydratase